MKSVQPPRLADRFLKFYCSSQYFEEVQGDLHEWFAMRVEEKGLVRARILYYYDVITYIRGFRLKRINEMEGNNRMLLVNYIKVASRQFKKNFWYSTLNALGLTVGILSALLISIYILDELSFDRFHKDSESIYRLVNYNPSGGDKSDATPSPWKANMKSTFPEISEHTRLGQDVVLIKQDEQNTLEAGFYWADDNFMSFFGFEVLSGDRKQMLLEPNSVVVTKSKALRYFGDVDVVGRTLPIRVYDGNKDFLMKITGVIEDVPDNSHLQFDFLGSMSSTTEMYGKFEQWWGLNWLRSYVKLPNDVDMEALLKKVPDFFERHRGEGASQYNGIIFQPLIDIRLGSTDIGGSTVKGNKDFIFLFGCVAIMVLLAASINYVNLTTAKSSLRGKEVGMRKVFGSSRKQIARQFYVECSFQILVALVLAVGFAMLLLPAFNSIVDKDMIPQDFFQTPVLVVMGSVYLFILLLAGFYPALVMNRFRPVDVIRGSISGPMGGKSWLRRLQVLVQFSIAAFLISSTLIVMNQMRHINQFDKGFNTQQLININVDDRSMQKDLMLMKQQMSQVAGVKHISASGEALPSAMNFTMGFRWEGKNDDAKYDIRIVAIDYDYLKTIEANLTIGRNLSEKLSTDSSQVCIINEAALRKTGWESIDGKKIHLDNSEREVVGVVENLHYNSLHAAVDPVVYMIVAPGSRASADNLILKLETANLANTLSGLDDVWKSFSDQPFDFSFVDKSFAELYGDENKFVKVVIGFALVGIFLTVLGLVGLVSFMAEKHAKEISIRKVLGAGKMEVFSKFGAPFFLIFLISMVLALPVSYLLMDKWLQNFAFSVKVSWPVFLIASGVSLFITLLSIGSQTLKVATSNPVKYLSDQ